MENSPAMELVQKIVDVGIDGVGPLESAEHLAREYAQDRSYTGKRSRIDGLIRWESSKNFTTGFVTGWGGLLTLPVAVPSALAASWFVQARLSAAVAALHGHDPKNDRVRTMALLSLFGNSAKEVLKDVGIQVGNKLGIEAIKRIPRALIGQINKAMGFALLAKAGNRGIINFTKILPVVSGFIGGTFDASTCWTVGHLADEWFAPASGS